MRFYHATAKEFLPSILSRGLLSDPPKRNYDGQYYLGDRGNAVYVCDYGYSSPWRTCHLGKFREPILLEIDFPPKTKLFDDELGGSGCYYYVGDIPPEWITVLGTKEAKDG